MGSREQFEAAFVADLIRDGYQESSAILVLERGSDGEYRSIRAAGAWWGWQQSRAELAIQMPDSGDAKYWVEYAEVDGQCFEWPLYNADVRAAIKAAGAKVIE